MCHAATGTSGSGPDMQVQHVLHHKIDQNGAVCRIWQLATKVSKKPGGTIYAHVYAKPSGDA